jgi:hypothetical protein
MTLQEINRTIISGQFSNEELNSIGDAIKFARSQLVSKNRGSLVKGTQVKFTNSRSGNVVIGTVTKVNRKFIIVQENRGGYLPMNWRVPANMLEAV